MIKLPLVTTSGQYQGRHVAVATASRQVTFTNQLNDSASDGYIKFGGELIVAFQGTPYNQFICAYDASTSSILFQSGCTESVFNSTTLNAVYGYRPTVLTMHLRIVTATYAPMLSWGVGVLENIGSTGGGNSPANCPWTFNGGSGTMLSNLVGTGNVKVFCATDMDDDYVHNIVIQCYPAYGMPYPHLQWNFVGDWTGPHIQFCISNANYNQTGPVSVQMYAIMGFEFTPTYYDMFDTKHWLRNKSKESYEKKVREKSCVIHVLHGDTALQRPAFPWKVKLPLKNCIYYMNETPDARSVPQLNIEEHHKRKEFGEIERKKKDLAKLEALAVNQPAYTPGEYREGPRGIRTYYVDDPVFK